MKMAKRIILILVVAAAVRSSMLYYARRGPNAAQTGTIPELISLIPADSPYLFYADLATLRASPFLARLVALAPAPTADPEYAGFVRATGFDYARDLDRVALAARPGSQSNLNVALAEGHFNHERISSYALRSGNMERHGGTEVYVFPPSATARAMAFAFLGVNRIVIAEGPEAAAVVRALASLSAPSGFGPAMRERITRVADAAIFAVGQVGRVPENFSVGGMRSDQFTNLVRSLRWFTLAARPEGDRLRTLAEGECDTAENARQLAGTLDALRALAQVALADPRTRQNLQPATAALLDALLRDTHVSRDDLRVRLSLLLAPEMLNPPPAASAQRTPSPKQRMR